VKLILDGKNLRVIKENGDPNFSGVKDAKGESRLLYRVKNALNANPAIVGLPAGIRFIKKRMWKDGHLVDDRQQYIRLAKFIKGKGILCFSNTKWVFRGADEDFRDVEACLTGEWI